MEKKFVRVAFDTLPKDVLDLLLLKMDIDSAKTLCEDYYRDCDQRNILGRFLERDFGIPPEFYTGDLYRQYKYIESYYEELDNNKEDYDKWKYILSKGKIPLLHIYISIWYKLNRSPFKGGAYANDLEDDLIDVLKYYYHPKIVKMLLDGGVDPSIGIPVVVSEQNLEALQFLLENGADPNFDDGRMIALAYGFEIYDKSLKDEHSELVTLLLKYGGDPKYLDKELAEEELEDYAFGMWESTL